MAFFTNPEIYSELSTIEFQLVQCFFPDPQSLLKKLLQDPSMHRTFPSDLFEVDRAFYFENNYFSINYSYRCMNDIFSSFADFIAKTFKKLAEEKLGLSFSDEDKKNKPCSIFFTDESTMHTMWGNQIDKRHRLINIGPVNSPENLKKLLQTLPDHENFQALLATECLTGFLNERESKKQEYKIKNPTLTPEETLEFFRLFIVPGSPNELMIAFTNWCNEFSCFFEQHLFELAFIEIAESCSTEIDQSFDAQKYLAEHHPQARYIGSHLPITPEFENELEHKNLAFFYFLPKELLDDVRKQISKDSALKQKFGNFMEVVCDLVSLIIDQKSQEYLESTSNEGSSAHTFYEMRSSSNEPYLSGSMDI